MIRYHVPYWTSSIMSEVSDQLSVNPFQSHEQLAKSTTEQFKDHFGYGEIGYQYFLSSATAALEVMALALEIGAGDEVIMPSFTHVSTANAFARRGAVLKFADIEMETLNLDPASVERQLSQRTKAIVPIHYGGIPVDLEAFQAIADIGRCVVLEDASHGIGANYNGKALGLHGEMGCLSFHQTKNLTAGGSGGCLFLNSPELNQRVETIISHGTNRMAFLRGEIPKYEWCSLGSEYEMPLYQLLFLNRAVAKMEWITKRRVKLWNLYLNSLRSLTEKGLSFSSRSSENGHIFYLLLPGGVDRKAFMGSLLEEGIETSTHYTPLHTTAMGIQYGRGPNRLYNTETVSERIVRLPLHHLLTEGELEHVVSKIIDYFK